MATQLQEAPQVPDAVIAAGVEPQAPEAQSPANDTRDFETIARKAGWKPQEEFAEGEPAPLNGFKSAEEFVRFSDDKAGQQKKIIARMAEEIQYLKRQQRHLIQSEQNAHANALEEIKAQMKEAVAVGDVTTFEALDRKADNLRKNMDTEGPHSENPAEFVIAFRKQNPWYDRGALAAASELEMEARAFADLTADEWITAGKPKTMKPSQFYAELAEAVAEQFPTLGQKAPRAKPASDVAPVTNRVTARSAKTGANLPPEAKQTAERYVRQKIPGFAGKTKEQAYELFAQSWKWES